MRVVILTTGTTGDVLPYTALGVGLQRAGHDVTVAAHAPLCDVVERMGLVPHPLPGDPNQLFGGAGWSDFQLSPSRPREHARTLHRELGALVDAVHEEHLEAAVAGAEGVIFTPVASRARLIAERAGVPSLMASVSPLHRTRRFPQPVLAPGLRLGPLGNLLSYPWAERLLNAPFAEPLRPDERHRRGLSMLPLVDGRSGRWPPFPVILGFSPALVPRPDDWPDHLHVTGAWTSPLTADGSLPEEVERFLSSGPPPLLITFGSMRPGFHEQLSDVLRGGLSRVGGRVLVQSTWLNLGLDGDRCLTFAEHVPHELLLPRVSAVIHHGGAGTTHAVARAGRPAWVCGFVFDQLFWGHRIVASGAGPRPCAAAALTADRVAEAIEALQGGRFRPSAERLALAMQAEDGIARGVELAERLMAADVPSGPGVDIESSRRWRMATGQTVASDGTQPGWALPKADELPPLPDLPTLQRLWAHPRLRESLPLSVGLALAHVRAELLWRKSAGGRAEALDAMSFLLGDSERAAEVPQLARRFVEETARRSEMEWRPHLASRFGLQGIDHLLGALSEQRGVLLHFMHYGPYVHIATVLDHHGVRLWAPISDYFFETPVAGFTGHKDRAHLRCLLEGCNPFPASGTFSIIGELLERGQLVALASDLPGSLPARFLGRNVLVSSGFSRLALAGGCPVVCVTWHPRSGGRLPVMRLHAPIDARGHHDPQALETEILAVHEPAVLAWPEALERPRMRWKPADATAPAA